MNIPQLFGPYGASALQYAGIFSEFGVNAAWFHGFDARAFEQCEQHGIAACVEFKTFRADFNKHPELVPIGIDGQPIRYGDLVQGVCLSQTAFLEETKSNLLDGLRQFNPAGIWFDYLTYAGWFETPTPDLQESCFCADCIADFCNATGIDADSPAEILAHHQHAWTEHKTDRITGFARQYSDLIHFHRPETIIGAYMCPWAPQEFDGALTRIFAQDYQKLSPYIDIFTPLIYVKKSGRTSSWGREFLEQAHTFIPAENKVSLILDALDGPDTLRETAASLSPSWGLQIFAGEKVFGDPQQAMIFRDAFKEIKTRV
ncbi:MAG: hypothetical protein V2J07_06745 [Anaerolineae bacterium]|jgi:hypothetical protein|nr:hypothetical protein [Anaerolineae bacterium]